MSTSYRRKKTSYNTRTIKAKKAKINTNRYVSVDLSNYSTDNNSVQGLGTENLMWIVNDIDLGQEIYNRQGIWIVPKYIKFYINFQLKASSIGKAEGLPALCKTRLLLVYDAQPNNIKLQDLSSILQSVDKDGNTIQSIQSHYNSSTRNRFKILYQKTKSWFIPDSRGSVSFPSFFSCKKFINLRKSPLASIYSVEDLTKSNAKRKEEEIKKMGAKIIANERMKDWNGSKEEMIEERDRIIEKILCKKSEHNNKNIENGSDFKNSSYLPSSSSFISGTSGGPITSTADTSHGSTHSIFDSSFLNENRIQSNNNQLLVTSPVINASTGVIYFIIMCDQGLSDFQIGGFVTYCFNCVGEN